MSDLLASIPPGTQPPVNVVTRKVFINGTELTNSVLLSQVSVQKSFNKIAFAKMVFLDGSAAARDFPLSNDDKFKPGNKIKIQLGYQGEADTVFEGIIVKHGLKVRQQGSSLLLIEAKDDAVKLTMARKSKYFNNKTDKDVITDLATGLQTDIEATTFSHKQLVQFDVTDWDFLVSRAEANGMLVLTDDGKLIVKKPSTTGTAVLTAKYGDNIWEFEAEMDARKQVKSVSSQSWDFSKQVLETKSGTASFTGNGNLSSTVLGNVLNAQVTLTHTGYLSGQLQDWANAYSLRNQLLKIVGRVRIQGKASVKPGNLIKLAGVGDRFNGDVYVTAVMHHYEGSWQTDIQFGWRDDWFFKKEDVISKPASGLLPGINGLQIGVVLEVNDTEQGGQYRVKVHIPTITTGNAGIWARVAALDAGPKRGAFFRPQTNDEVVLGFLNDDPRDPIVLGYLHSKSTNEAPLPEQQGSLESGFVTKEGIKLVFDDTNKRLTLLVPMVSGDKSVILNSTAGAIEMKDENQNSIKMDSTGITIQAGPGKLVIINGQVVKINS
jgi:Rhs element Vgr protein